MSEETSAERPVDDGMLRGFWYPALLSREIRSHALYKAVLLDVPLVLGRDANGYAFALRDFCPHRGMPLSFGHLDGSAVECCYHGWRFDARSGQCLEIPSLTSNSKLRVERIFAGSYPCEEADGYIWVFMPEQEIAGRVPENLPPVPRLPVFSERYRIAHLRAEIPVSVDHGIIGLMDPAHGPFVHQAWWWRTRRSIREKEKQFEPIPNGFRMSPHTPSTNSAPYKLLRYMTGEAVTTTIDFILPNQRFEQIRAGKYWLSSRATVTPIRRDLCRLDFCAAWNILNWLPLVTSIIHVLGPRFIRQDAETMKKQAAGLKYKPQLMLIDDADCPARWYFQLKAAYLESRRTGAPTKHPLEAPVTLRWRS